MIVVGKEEKWIRNVLLDIKSWPHFNVSYFFYTMILKELCRELTEIFIMINQDI